MNADDPRHGTISGHVAGCREQCCVTVRASYDKRRKYAQHTGQPFTLSNTGILRRVRALQAIGWSIPQIADAAGLSAKTLHAQLYYGRAGIRRATAQAIAHAYERLSMTPGTGHYANANRRKAKARGWAPPLAWENIDDPNAEPWTPRKNEPGRPTLHRVEDLDWLADSGENLTNAAERLGLDPDSVHRICLRAGRMDIYWRLANREPNAEHRRASGAGTRRAKGAA